MKRKMKPETQWAVVDDNDIYAAYVFCTRTRARDDLRMSRRDGPGGQFRIARVEIREIARKK